MPHAQELLREDRPGAAPDTPRGVAGVPAVVLGLGINGLGIVRGLGYRGIPVVGGFAGDCHVGRYSRYLVDSFRYDADDPASLLARLVETAAAYPGRPVLFATSDDLVRFMGEHRETLARHYRFNLPDATLLPRILDKFEFHRLAVEAGTPVPASYSGRTLDEVRAALRNATYPVLAKPATAGAVGYIDGGKNEVVRGPAQFERRFAGAGRVIAEFVFQEIVPIRDEDVYYCTGYYSADRNLLGLFSARKLRQYPPSFGVTSCAVSRPLPEVRALATRFLDRIGFTGLFDIEFVRDPRDGSYQLIEINPRTHQANIHGTDCGVNLPYLCYRDLVRGDAAPLPEQKSGVGWVALELDVPSFLRKLRAREVRPWSWLRSLLGARSFAYFSWRDPWPSVRKALSPRRNFILRRLFRL